MQGPQESPSSESNSTPASSTSRPSRLSNPRHRSRRNKRTHLYPIIPSTFRASTSKTACPFQPCPCRAWPHRPPLALPRKWRNRQLYHLQTRTRPITTTAASIIPLSQRKNAGETPRLQVSALVCSWGPYQELDTLTRQRVSVLKRSNGR